MTKINNINRREFLEIFGCCSCGLLVASCASAPITERKQLKLIPEATLNRQAVQIYENVKRKTKLSNDKKQLDEIKDIGSRIEESVSLYFESKNMKEIDSAMEVINEAWKNASEEMYKAQADAQASNSSKSKGDTKSKSTKKTKDDGDNVQDVDFEEVK